MNIISTLERDIARLEAHATYHEKSRTLSPGSRST